MASPRNIVKQKCDNNFFGKTQTQISSRLKAILEAF